MCGQALLPFFFVYTECYILADQKNTTFAVIGTLLLKAPIVLSLYTFLILGTDKQELWQTVKTKTQTADNPVTWHHKEEPHNNHETPGIQIKQTSQLSLHHQYDCKTRMNKVLEQLQNPTMGKKNQQRINNSRATTLERTAVKATGGLNAFCWYQIFALDHIFVEAQTILSSHGDFLTIAMYQHREKII